MGAFDVENRFWTKLNLMTDMFLLWVLSVVFSIPVVTAGASMCGLYRGMMLLAEEKDGHVWKDFISGFRSGFESGTKVWLMQLAVGSVLCLNAFVSFRVHTVLGLAVMIINLVLLLLVLCASMYFYPTIARYNFPVRKIVRDGFITSVTHFAHSVSLVLLLGIAAFLSIKVRFVFAVAIPFAFYQVARVNLWVFSGYSGDTTGDRCNS